MRLEEVREYSQLDEELNKAIWGKKKVEQKEDTHRHCYIYKNYRYYY